MSVIRVVSSCLRGGRRREQGRSRPKAGLGAAATVAILGAMALLGPLAGTSGALVPPSAAASPGRAVLTPALADRLVHVGAAVRLPAGARLLGRVAPSTAVSGDIVLTPRHAAELSRLAATVTNPASPLYGQYLRRGEFAGLFGPTESTVRSVSRFLTSEGVAVTSVSSNHLIVGFRGPAASIDAAFHASLENVRLANGVAGSVPRTAPLLPSGIASAVTAVTGLDNLVHARALDLAPPGRVSRPAPRAAGRAPNALPRIAGAPHACAAAASLAAGQLGVTDDQVAASYGANGLYGRGDLGAGQTIALVELAPFAPSDIATFERCYFGNSRLSQLSVIPVDGGQTQGSDVGFSNTTEDNLDIDDVVALAPAAHVDVYLAPNNTSGSIDEYNRIVSDDAAHTISTSWGFCEPYAAAYAPGVQQAENTIFEQGALQGQSVFSAAGDSGSDDCWNQTPNGGPALSADDPSSQPFVTGVGGTTFLATPPKATPQETVWNDGYSAGAGGGGISASWPMPAWQQFSGVPGVINHYSEGTSSPYEACQAPVADGGSGVSPLTPCREEPDVAALADPFTGITEYQASAGGWFTEGGTSSSAPIWAALLADIDASAGCATTLSVHHDVGFVTPELYRLAANPKEYAEAFNDITTGNNDQLGLAGGAYPATKGYDMASGLGTPKVTNPANGGTGLAPLLCDEASAAPSPVVSSLSPLWGPTSGGTTVTVRGSGFEHGTTPDVAAVSFGASDVLAPFVTVLSNTELKVTAPRAYLPTTYGQPAVGGQVAAVTVALTSGLSSRPGAQAAFHYVSTAHSGYGPTVGFVSATGGTDAGGKPVTVFGSGFLDLQSAHPTPQVSAVDFGGVAGSHIKVKSDSQLTVEVPPAAAATDANGEACPTAFVDLGACQVQVTVTAGGVRSATTKIVTSEIEPAPTEFDYAQAPQISSIAPSNGDPMATEGSEPVTITGNGFNWLTLNWVSFGPPSLSASPQAPPCFGDDGVAPCVESLTADQMVVLTPNLPATVDQTTVGVTVSSLGGTSNTVSLEVAGVPVVTGLSSHLGLTTGGAPLTVRGQGFNDAFVVAFVSRFEASLGLASAQYVFTAENDATITLLTPADVDLPTDVVVCSLSGCSAPDASVDGFLYAYPGRAVVTSISPASGPARGGTLVKITGRNLSNVQRVEFGKKLSKHIRNGADVVPAGSPTLVYAVAPAGTKGKKVSVNVQTWGGIASHNPPSAASRASTFTYRSSGSAANSGFAANSMTWLSPNVGWILGSAGSGSETKTDILRTLDGGKTWRLVGSAKAAIPQIGVTGGKGVTELRFATAKIGYAFAPGLYRTTNGGATFAAMPLPGGGRQVLALAANAKEVYVVVSPCAWASGICSHKPLELWRRSILSQGAWTPVSVGLPINDAADLSLHGTSVYVVDAQRTVTGKPDKFYASTDGVHFASRPVPCDTFPDIALLQAVATSATGVDLLCDGDPGFGKAVKFAYRSSDTGNTDVSAGTMGDSWGIEAQMAVSPTGNLAVASWSIGSFMWINDSRQATWSMVIGSGDGGRGWNDPTYVSGKVAWVVYSPVSMFHGVGKIYLTTNGGKTWRIHSLS